MKAVNAIMLAAVSFVALTASSCSNDSLVQDTADQGGSKTISVSVNGLIGEYIQAAGTKSSLSSTIRVKWADEDKVYAFDGTKCLGTLSVSLKDNVDYFALLSGTLNAPTEGTTKITLVHSNLSVTPTIEDGKVTVDISAQTGSAQADNLPFVAYGTLDYTQGDLNISNKIVDFSFATSLLRLNCYDLTPSQDIKNVTINGISNQCVLAVSVSGVSVETGATGTISLACTDFKASDKGTKMIYAAIAKTGASTSQKLKIYQDKKFKYSISSNSRNEASLYNLICKMETVVIPEKVISGEFSVSPDKQVYFSKGNLQATYNSSTSKYTWGFAANQYDYIGNASGNTTIKSQIDGAVVDVFRWSCDANFGIQTENFFDNFNDWGKAIDDKDTWVTLAITEWNYLINRTVNGGTGEGKSYQRATINSDVNGGVFGAILYPDNYTAQTNETSYSTTEWTEMEKSGCVFLPAAGRNRHNGDSLADDTYYNAGISGYYNAADSYDPSEDYEYMMFIGKSSDLAFGRYNMRDAGCVRLVTSAE